MGIIDKLRAELIDIVEWIDDSRHTLVWRFPRFRNQIKYGAQLVVRPGQSAIFVKQGQIADVFGPGHHRLETRNLPILSTIAGWKHGFDSPFKAEVYFVSTRQITDLKWGTPNPVLMRDPDFGPVRVRAFGTYTLRALDPATLLKELVGTDSSFEANEIHELLRSIISTSFADVIAKSELPILDLAANYQRLSDELREMVVQRIDDEYGLDLPQLYIVNVSVPAEVEQALDTRSSINAIGDMATFQAYQLGQAMPVAAANPAGGLAGAGVGLGMGAAMAGPMLSGASGAAPNPPQSPPPPPAPPAVLWHVAQAGQSFGPFTEAQVAQAIAEGRIQRDTSMWTAGMAGWAAAASLDALAALFGTPPPPPPAESG
ncbi:MAG: SPFH domain-containing protein [Deltaproteobacteria bacterium]|nr:SPFH domain-containing protein [Deltaproteobacteria bacterium]